MPRDIEEPSQDKWGADVHPAFGMIGASRVTSTPGQVLFDSDVRHGNTVVLRIKRASRKRDLNSDYIHASSNDIVEVEMSEAQWASFVSTMNHGDGVPCTIRRTEQDGAMPGLSYAPRLALSMDEVHIAAARAFGEILGALSELDELEKKEKVGVKERRAALAKLRNKIENATPNVDFAGKQLSKHAENVVNKARADIEAYVLAKAKQLKLEAGDIEGLYELSGPTLPMESKVIDQ